MSAFAKYQAAKERKKTAYARYNLAGAELRLAQIEERMAEIISQHQPLAELNPEGNPMARVKQISAAFWVLYGRWPDKNEIDP